MNNQHIFRFMKCIKFLFHKPKYSISSYWKGRFDEQIHFRKFKHGKPLSIIQKIKAARAISHIKYPTSKYSGLRGHNIRDKFRIEILKLVNVDYKPRVD